MTAETLLALAERCEAAAGADRELDEEIAAALQGAIREVWKGEPRYHVGTRWVALGPIAPVTSSLDAAMTLVDPQHVERILGPDKGGMWEVQLENEDGYFEGRSPSFPLAICAAALKARACDTDRSGEAGETAKQAQPIGREPGPQSGIAQTTEPQP